MITLWKLAANVLRPAVDAWNVYIKGNLEVDGTIQLDGGVTLDGSVIVEETSTEALLVRKEADGGDLIAFNTTSNIILHTGDHNAANAAGPAVLNEAASSTNPTLVPNKADPDTGTGWISANKTALIAGGVNAMSIEATVLTPNVPIASGTIEITEAAGNQDINLVDIAITATSLVGESKSYALAIDANPIITAKALSDGAGSISELEAILGGYLRRKSSTAITADAGSAQGGSPLVSDVNVITVCAIAGDSITLPVDQLGREILVINNGAQSADCFPASGDDLGAGVNTAVAIAATAFKRFVCVATNTWKDVS